MIEMIPDWVKLLAAGFYIVAMMAGSCVIWSRAGRSPYYALFWLVPIIQVVLLWMLAFQDWPTVKVGVSGEALAEANDRQTAPDQSL